MFKHLAAYDRQTAGSRRCQKAGGEFCCQLLIRAVADVGVGLLAKGRLSVSVHFSVFSNLVPWFEWVLLTFLRMAFKVWFSSVLILRRSPSACGQPGDASENCAFLLLLTSKRLLMDIVLQYHCSHNWVVKKRNSWCKGLLQLSSEWAE